MVKKNHMFSTSQHSLSKAHSGNREIVESTQTLAFKSRVCFVLTGYGALGKLSNYLIASSFMKMISQYLILWF